MTGQELLHQGIIDEVIPEPLGGAHRDIDTMADRLAQTVDTHLRHLEGFSPTTLLTHRDEKFRRMQALRDSMPAKPHSIKTASSG